MKHGTSTVRRGVVGAAGPCRGRNREFNQTLSIGLASGPAGGIDRSRSWADERRRTGIVAQLHSWATSAQRWRGWVAAYTAGIVIAGIMMIVWGAAHGCAGTTAATTAGCVDRVTECPTPTTTEWPAWLNWSLCTAGAALPCVIGSVEAGQSGCPSLEVCLAGSVCTSDVQCRQAVELCLDECR